MLINGTVLSYKKTGATGEYTTVKELLDIPEIGVSKEKIETTCISDTAKKYEFGIGDAGELAFTIGTEADEDMVQYLALLNMDTSNEVVDWKVVYPNGFTISFKAMVNVVLGGGKLNDHATYTLNLALCSALTQTKAQ